MRFQPQTPLHPQWASLGAQMAIIYRENAEAARREVESLIVRQRLDDAIAEEAKKYFHV